MYVKSKLQSVILTWYLILPISILLTSPAHSKDSVEENEISRLISLLGDSDFNKRDAASRQLRMLGFKARTFLEKAIKSKDPEIRFRAKEILKDIKLGINPLWPEELQKEARNYQKLDRSSKQVLIEKISSRSSDEALPFLFLRLEAGDPDDADFVLKKLIKSAEEEDLWQDILNTKKEPVNKYQASLFAEAVRKKGKLNDLLKIIKNKHLENSEKSKMVKKQQAILHEYFEEEKYAKIAELSKALAKALPDNAIFLYFHGIALEKLNRPYEADKAMAKALSLNPDKEAPHYTAGEFLMNLGQFRLSEKEWKKILEIPPEDDVYDINAYMRLTNIYSQSKLYAKALETLETGLKKFKEAKEKHGSSMGMVGADSVEQRLAYLRKMANKYGNASDGVKDKAPEKKQLLKFNLQIIVKDDKFEEMNSQLKESIASLSISVEPYGFRILKKNICTLKYDKETKKFSVLLHKSPLIELKDLVLQKPKAKIAINDLDTCFIYSIDRDTGKVSTVVSFEKDYKLKITKGEGLKSWQDPAIKINGKEHSWKVLKEGLPMDYLPKKLDVEVNGLSATGKKKNLKFTTDPRKAGKR